MSPSLKSRKKIRKITAAELFRRRSEASKKAWQTRRLRAVEAQQKADIAAGEKILRKLERKLERKRKAAKKRKKKVEPCPKRIYARVVEQVGQWQIRKYNVSGIQRLPVKCLAKLIDQQIARGAYYFRFWWAGNAYHAQTEDGRVRSTHLMDAERIQGEYGSTEKFLKKLGGPVLYYWFDLHGGPARVVEGLEYVAR